ncbi:MAG: histidinol phosphatase [Firmicutes bacterium HGW-Firmicutes-21]|nr:MAG: histidinol phosphatase [Firmicutes bacterium HGW-Firmicutes-21]
MSRFIYDTHVHTSEVSPCAHSPAEAVVTFYKEIGYSGIIITDHFACRDNTPADSSAWEAAVYKLCKGYNKAFELGKKIGLQVFFAWEYTRVPHIGTDFLTYGLDADWLLSHSEISSMSINEYSDFIRSEGGFLTHAHPFRDLGWTEMIRLLPKKVDAVEVYNANRTDFENDRALEYANNYSLLKTSGTDNHLGPEQKDLGGMVFDTPLNDISDFISAVRDGRAQVHRETL